VMNVVSGARMGLAVGRVSLEWVLDPQYCWVTWLRGRPYISSAVRLKKIDTEEKVMIQSLHINR